MINRARRAAKILVNPRDVIRAIIRCAPFLEIERSRMSHSGGVLNPIIAWGLGRGEMLGGRGLKPGPAGGDDVIARTGFKSGINQYICAMRERGA